VKLPVFNDKLEKIGEKELEDSLLKKRPSTHTIWEVIRMYILNQKSGTNKAKTRGEVKASTRKIWMQKGLGRARHGSISAPIFVGGGKAHPPKGVKRYFNIPKRMKNSALRGILLDRIENNKVWIIDSFPSFEAKTKQFVDWLKQKNLEQKKILLIQGEPERNLFLATRNLKNITTRRAYDVNALDVIKRDYVFVDKRGLEIIGERLKWTQETS